MIFDFLISAPGLYTGNLSEDFSYDNLREDLREEISALRGFRPVCVRLLSDFLVLRLADLDVTSTRDLERISIEISRALTAITKPSHETPLYRFAVLTEHTIS